MRILSLEIQDILSIQSASMSFEDAGLILVEGWNYDTQRANGAGKTAIFNCLSFGLYDKLPRKITASEILRRGSKSGSVKCSVLCGEDIWTVFRTRPKGVKFYKNDIEQDISQEEFELFIRLSYEQFLLTIYTPQANSGSANRFLSANDSSKKDFLLQLLNLNQFSTTKKIADDIIKARQASIDIEEKKIHSYRAKIAAYEESLVDIDSLLALIEKLETALPIIKQDISTYLSISRPDLSKYTQIEESARVKLSEIAQAKAKRSMLHDKYRELNASICSYDPDMACQECGSSLDTQDARSSHGENQNRIKERVAIVKAQIDECDTVISKESGINDMMRNLQKKKTSDSAAFQEAQLKLAELRALQNRNESQIQNNQSKVAQNSDLLNKINQLNVGITSALHTVTELKKDLELYKTLSNIYSPTGAQAYVLDSIIDSFNEVIQKYIDLMSPNMTYQLNSFKETTKGDVVAKFSENLTKAGEEISVGSLSGGEEKGLSLCVDFALLEVLETQFGMSLNPIILDEPFDGLDTAGREIVVDLLENLARMRQIFIVDHSSEAKAMFTKSIKVELRNKISTITHIT